MRVPKDKAGRVSSVHIMKGPEGRLRSLGTVGKLSAIYTKMSDRNRGIFSPVKF